jgi:hypothetical protein
VLGLVFKTSVRHSVSQVGSTPTSFRHSLSITHTAYDPVICRAYFRSTWMTRNTNTVFVTRLAAVNRQLLVWGRRELIRGICAGPEHMIQEFNAK